MVGHHSAKNALLGSTLAAMMLLGVPALAQDPADQASAAYRRGQAASARRDYLEAAKAFAEADSILANPVALESAIQAAVLADDAALGMQLAERAHRDSVYAGLSVVQEALDKFRSRVGKIEVACDTAALCEATVDGVALPGKEGWFVTGVHQVALRAGDRRFEQSVTLEGGGRVEVKMPPAPPPSPSPVVARAKPPGEAKPPADEEGSVDGGEVVFWTGVGLTGAVAVGAFVSLGDLVAQHGAFASSCEDAVGEGATCAALASDGQSAQTRTWILGGAAMGLAVATAIVGATVVDWSDARSSAALRVRVGPSGVSFEGAL